LSGSLPFATVVSIGRQKGNACIPVHNRCHGPTACALSGRTNPSSGRNSRRLQASGRGDGLLWRQHSSHHGEGRTGRRAEPAERAAVGPDCRAGRGPAGRATTRPTRESTIPLGRPCIRQDSGTVRRTATPPGCLSQAEPSRCCDQTTHGSPGPRQPCCYAPLRSKIAERLDPAGCQPPR
jgi:hypothetical protein